MSKVCGRRKMHTLNNLCASQSMDQLAAEHSAASDSMCLTERE